ncbi:NUDIX hydrolase [Schleiferia thermophila]
MIPDNNKEQYFNVALATGIVLFAFDLEHLHILLTRKKEEPFKGAWVIPSRYVKADESLEENVKVLLKNTIGHEDVYLEQLNAFAKVYRNPIGRVVNIPFYGLMQLTEKEFKNAEKNNCKWIKYHDVPDMAFDHNEIIDYAKERLKRRVKRRPVGFNSLPKEFTLNQLQTLYEQALNKIFDKRNFRKKIFNSQLLVDTGKTIITSQGKESKLYKFDMERYEKMSLKGYDFLF